MNSRTRSDSYAQNLPTQTITTKPPAWRTI